MLDVERFIESGKASVGVFEFCRAGAAIDALPLAFGYADDGNVAPGYISVFDVNLRRRVVIEAKLVGLIVKVERSWYCTIVFPEDKSQ